MPNAQSSGEIAARRRARSEFFRSLPADANRIAVHSMVADLAAQQKADLRAYLVERFPGSPEVADALFHVAAIERTHLRTKELIETVEAFVHAQSAIQNAITAARKDRTRTPPTAIFDMACGHGLGAVLLAYRFSKLRVVAVDREKRACFGSFVAAFVANCEAAPHESVVLENLSFFEGDIEATTPAPVAGAFFLCVHGCKGVSPLVMELAQRVRGGYCVMPCCIDGAKSFGLRTSSCRARWALSDGQRYATQVGYLAGRFNAEVIAPIDEGITNKNLVICDTRMYRSAPLAAFPERVAARIAEVAIV